jgi:hypothetical protein
VTKPRKPLECEDCGELCVRLAKITAIVYKRHRCAQCKKLVCDWCMGHVHHTKADLVCVTR